MATYTIDKIGYNGNTYLLQDAGALQLTGGNVTGPVNFGSSVSMDEATIGDLVVNGAASFTNNLQANTINGVAVGSSPKFTDTVYSHPSHTAYSSGLYKITVNNLGHVTAATAVAKADITGLGIPGSDTNTWRAIQVNGTDILGTGTNTNKLNLKAGSNVTITNSNGTVTIASSYTDTNTHYTANLITGASATATSNAANTTTNSIYLNLIENSTVRNSHNIVGSGATTVSCDANGKITISSTDTNTHNTYTVSTTGSGNAVTAVSLSGTTFTVTKGTTFLTSLPSHNHSQIVTVGDQRSTATTPNSYANALIFQGLKNKATIGNPSTDTYSYLVGLRGWSDSSGGKSHELAFNDTGINWRTGSTTAWDAWYKLLTTKDLNSTTSVGTIGSGKVYAIGLDANGKLAVSVPWTDTTYTLSGLGGVGTVSASGTAPLTLSASKSGTTVTITGSVAAVSSSSAGVAPKGATVSSQTQSTKFLREDGTWAAPSYTVNTNTDTLVTQTATSTNANYEVLFSATADNTTHTETARKNSNLTFNPSTGILTATKLIGAVPEANLTWGGKDFSASYGPIDAAMIDTLGANRFAFLKAAGLTIEYSTNGGSSYTDYGATNAQKVGLFSSGQSFHLGKHTSSGSCTTNDRLRVTIDTGAAGIYTVLNKIAIYMSTNGSTVQVLIERALQSTPTTFQTHKDWTGISGWSGWNILNISELTTYGNTAGSQYGRIRFTFRATAVNTNYAAAQISKIQGYGGQGWTVPSNMAANGHLYSYDSSQNATFPGKVTASGGFSGDLTGNVTGNVSGSAGSVAWANVTGKPTATGSKTTGISIAAHTTTSITPVSGSVTASKASGGNGSASNWVFEDVACDDITAWSAGSFTRGTFSGGSGSFTQGTFSGGSGSFSATVSNHVLSFSHTHNAATHGTDTHTHTAATHAADSFTAPSLSYSAKTASHVKSGGNGSAPTWSFTDVTVPKAASAVNVVTSTGHTITDNGHTHSIS